MSTLKVLTLSIITSHYLALMKAGLRRQERAKQLPLNCAQYTCNRPEMNLIGLRVRLPKHTL